MKKILLSFFSISIFVVLVSFTVNRVSIVESEERNVKWMTFEEAIEATAKAQAAGEKPKKIFIDIYTDWCGWCKKMDSETFEYPPISDYLNAHFYPVKFNAEQKEMIQFAGKDFKFVPNGRRGYHELAAALLDGKMSYPTVVFAHFKEKNFELLQRIPGYLDRPTFDMIMHYLSEEHYLQTPWVDYQNMYKTQNPAKQASQKK